MGDSGVPKLSGGQSSRIGEGHVQIGDYPGAEKLFEARKTGRPLGTEGGGFGLNQRWYGRWKTGLLRLGGRCQN